MGLGAREKPPRAATAARKRHVPRQPPIPILPSDPTAPSSIPTANKFDESGWGYCTEEQLEEIVINNLDCVYNEAISRLVSLGYDDNLALRAVLCNGHCYGAMDAVSNILQNALAYLNSETAAAADEDDPPAGAFSDLRHLEEYSLAGMVCLLQQIRADLSRGEAMWCLLMSGLHVSRASSVELPSVSIHGSRQGSVNGSSTPSENSMPFPKPNISEYCPELKMQGRERPQEAEEEGEDLVQLVLKNLELMRIEDEKYEDKEVHEQKKEMIMDLIRQIRELEGHIKERKEWAQEKAMQAARKLSNDLHELRMLRMGREENQRTVKGKQVLEDSTMKRLGEMESALKKASGQVDRANAVVKKMETENAEIRAEMVASKLSASESVSACMEVSKREKKYLKKLMAWEKQKEKMQEEIAEKRKKIVQVQQQLAEVQEASKQVEFKWRQEVQGGEEALSALEEERRAKDAAEANCKRRLEGLRQKIEIDFKRYKDDIHRLEEELSRRREVATAARLIQSVEADSPKPLVESNPKVLLPESRESPQKNNHRICWLCRENEVSVVFLPCAHQVLCYGCNEGHREKGCLTCTACKLLIDDRIHVYGAKS